MGGILGRLLHEFAVTIGVAILVSGVVSLSLTPMMCSRFLKRAKEQRHNRLYNLSATVYLFTAVPKGFLPSEDTGQIFAFTEAAQGISYQDMVQKTKQLTTIVVKDPYVDTVMPSVGGSRGNATSNSGTLFLKLKPRSQRPHVDQIIQELRPKLSKVPGIQVFMQNLPPIRIGGQLTKSQYQFALQSPDTDELYANAPKLEAKLRGLAQLQDVTSDLQIKNPQVNVQIDRDKASALGVTAQQIEDALYTAYGTRQVSTIYAPNNTYRVIMELEPEFQRDPGSLSMLYIRSTTGQLVPLNAVANVTKSVGPLSVNHLGQLPAVTISFNLRPGVSLGDALKVVYQSAREVLPSTVTTSFQGTAQAFESSLKGLGLLLIMAVLVIYIVLGILYESFIHPLTILSGLPSAGFGALLMLMLFHMELNLYAFVGVIMLVGIVKKNAIMMIDFAIDAERSGGKTPAEAIYYGALVRFRPIMMTTMAALLGGIPLALGTGTGSELRHPLGITIVGGLLVSQLLTLYTTPVVYLWFDRLAQRFSRFQIGNRIDATPSEAAGD